MKIIIDETIVLDVWLFHPNKCKCLQLNLTRFKPKLFHQNLLARKVGNLTPQEILCKLRKFRFPRRKGYKCLLENAGTVKKNLFV